MRIGIYVSTPPDAPVEAAVASFERAEERGFHTAWLGQLDGYDALTVLALAGRATRRIELGSWVVPTYPRHPAALAQQALTVQSACGGRLVLGIGVSHRALVAKRWGLDYGRPLRHAREYLEVLRPLLAGEPARHAGEELRVALALSGPAVDAPPVLLAALGPKMLELAGARADGAAIWLGGPRYLEGFAIPRLRAAARAVGRPEPRIACGFPVLLTNDTARGRAAAEAFLAPSSRLPAYRRVLEREGAGSPADVAIIGDERAIEERLKQLAELGVSDLTAVVVPTPLEPGAADRTRDLLAALSPARPGSDRTPARRS